MKVKITKRCAVKDPVVRTATKKEYICGQEQDEEVSPFKGYWVIGTLERPIEVGKPIRMLRENRNGVKAMGLFTTSVVRTITDKDKNGLCVVETDNSVYGVCDIDGQD